MIIALDAFYTTQSAKTVGVLFHSWTDAEPVRVVISHTGPPHAYEPGQFYKRELPCIQALLEQVSISEIHTIVVDGYVYLNNEKKPGLGHYVYQAHGGRIPVVGVAKTAFHNNEALVRQVYRGISTKPLYITAAGMELEDAAAHVQSMYGQNRFPHLLKLLDTKTKEP